MPRDPIPSLGLRPSLLALSLVALVPACAGPEAEPGPTSLAASPLRRACTAGELAAITSAGDSYVDVGCSVTLSRGARITHSLRFVGDAADDVTFDCAGGTIDGDIRIESKLLAVGETAFTVPKGWSKAKELQKESNGLYKRQRPERVTIRRCKINGGTRIAGLGDNGQALEVEVSSRDHLIAPGHPTRARDAAPRDITFEDVDINISGGKAFYVAPGVTRFTLVDSRITGTADAMVIYFDAESQDNTLRHNVFRGKTNRELISLDGSSRNLIVNNDFHNLDDGGIYLYRNCGEGGIARISTPNRNRILNNYFYYDRYTGDKPAIWLSSRDASTYDHYCADDRAHPFGSGEYDWDYARYNVVMQNQIRSRTVSDMIRTQHETINSPNYVSRNEQVSGRIDRRAGCYLPSGYATDFLADGARARVIDEGASGTVCTWKRCEDGELRDEGSCAMKAVPFECAANTSNEGCEVLAKCPAQTVVLGATATCDLERGTVTAAELAAVPPGRVTVATLSDVTDDGRCWVSGTTVKSREDRIRGSAGATSVTGGCREHDQNGGDCAIRGTLYCEAVGQ